MSISGSWCLIISGNQINFDEIRDKLRIEPSRTTRKGEVKSKVIGPSQFDSWVFEQKFESSDEIAKTLDKLLAVIHPHKGYINVLSDTFDVIIKFFVQSNFAQIGVALPPYLIKKIAEINVKIEISVLSWGEVENN